MSHQDPQFVSCPQCAISGHQDCDSCGGARYIGFIDSAKYYWGLPKKNFDKLNTGSLKLRSYVKAGFFYLTAFSMFALSLATIVTSIGHKQSQFITLFTKSTPLSLLFWVLLGLLLYSAFLYYYRKPESRPVLVRSGSINIAPAFNPQITHQVYDSLAFCAKNNIQPNAWSMFVQLLSDSNFLWLVAKLEIDIPSLITFSSSQLTSLLAQNDKYFPTEYDEILIRSYVYASEMGSKQVTWHHLFLACYDMLPELKTYLEKLHLSRTEIDIVVNWREDLEKQIQSRELFLHQSRFKPTGHMNQAWTAVPTPTLDAFSYDLTVLAKYEQITKLVGREKLIEQAINILEKPSRNNVLFVGDTGVGKSTIINGLAYRMASENVPLKLKDKRLIQLKLSELFASGGERLFIRALQECIRAGNIILYVDDLHMLAGVKTMSGGPLDAIAMLGEYLNQYRIQFIASTTIEGHSKYISSYEQMVSLLSVLNVEEIDNPTAVEVIKKSVGVIENQSGVIVSLQAIISAVELSSDLIVDKKLPSKALELLQEASVVCKNSGRLIVTKKDIQDIIQQKTNIPIETVTSEESDKLMHLEDELHKRVIGQDTAVEQTASAIKRARAGLKDKNKPIATFLFVGPTGVGKTELAKALASIYFGKEDAMIRLDMSEYQEIGDIKKLIGAPPGSSEFEERGYLTESVKRHPFSLILLDELEKAHSDILNLFLQILDEGKIKDSLGQLIKFNHSIIIATSNAGARLIQEGIQSKLPISQIEQKLMIELKNFYRPEFLNRFDGVVMFQPLNHDEIKQVANLMIKRINTQLAEKKISVIVQDQALEDFIATGYNPEFGARGLFRTLQDKVTNQVAEKMLSRELGEGKTITIQKDGESIVS